jgi:hypothetical protein
MVREDGGPGGLCKGGRRSGYCLSVPYYVTNHTVVSRACSVVSRLLYDGAGLRAV